MGFIPYFIAVTHVLASYYPPSALLRRAMNFLAAPPQPDLRLRHTSLLRFNKLQGIAFNTLPMIPLYSELNGR